MRSRSRSTSRSRSRSRGRSGSADDNDADHDDRRRLVEQKPETRASATVPEDARTSKEEPRPPEAGLDDEGRSRPAHQPKKPPSVSQK